YRDAVVVNANDDSLPDILLVGNFYENTIEMGRNDADFGTILLNRGNGTFTAEPINGLAIKGQIRHIRRITIAGKEAFILARTNDSALVIRFTTPHDALPLHPHNLPPPPSTLKPPPATTASPIAQPAAANP